MSTTDEVDWSGLTRSSPWRPLNYDQPNGVPVKPMGRIPVIARFVWPDGITEYLPAHAIRWTKTHVHVTFYNERNTSYPDDDGAWLHGSDVLRGVRWLIDPITGGPEAPHDPYAPRGR